MTIPHSERNPYVSFHKCSLILFAFLGLFLSSLPAFTTGVGGNNAGYVKDCCNRDNTPCTELSGVGLDITYTYDIAFDVYTDVDPAQIDSFTLTITDPNGLVLTADNLVWKHFSSYNSLSLPYVQSANTTQSYVAVFEVELASSSNYTSVPTGNYRFDIGVSGVELSSKPTSFSFVVTLAHEINATECEYPIGLDPVNQPDGNGGEGEGEGGGSEREFSLEHTPDLTTQWYPNPTADHALLNLDLKDETQCSLEIMNTQGQLVYKPFSGITLGRGVHTRKLDVSKLPAGVYYTRVVTNEVVQVIKWVKLE